MQVFMHCLNQVLGAHNGESGRGSNPLMMAGGQKKGGDKEPATWRVPSSFECEARKALVPDLPLK